MASVSTDPKGFRTIHFTGADRKRRTLRLGKVALKSAELVCRHVEALVSASILGNAPADETTRWIAGRGAYLYDRLAAVGLVQPRKVDSVVELGPHIANYVAKRTDVKPNTLIQWRHTKRSLLLYFGADRPLASITPGEARDWERWLKTGKARMNRYAATKATEGLAINTLRKRVSVAKQFFDDAVSRELIPKNPFSELKGTVGTNRDRDHFVSLEISLKVLDACPDKEWRVLFSLSRWGGLRCPSEHLGLKWGDIDWKAGRFTVRSPKTEHHDGGAERLVPLFPELRTELQDLLAAVKSQSPDGTDLKALPVITRYRTQNANLRSRLIWIIKRAGQTPWPKLFQNLRATRATELAGEHPAHVAAAWLGHSTLIANKHYWRVTESDFSKATEVDQPSEESPTQNPTFPGTIQQGIPRPGTEMPPAFPQEALSIPLQITYSMPPEGLEPSTL